MIEKAKLAVQSSSPQSSVYVGCDSICYRKNDKQYAKYSTVIIVHMDSNRGCRLFHTTVDLPDYGNLKQRLMTEVNYAIAAATEIIDVLDGRHMEIHLDINPNPKHKSSAAVKEALGWVKGTLGLDAVVKPHSFAASHAADHVVRH